MKSKIQFYLLILVLALGMSLIYTKPISASSTPKMYMSPNTSSAASGQSFTVDINVKDVKELYAWEFYLNFSSTLLNVTKISEGPFLNSSAHPSFFVPKLNISEGTAYAADTLTGVARGGAASGEGTIATVTFEVKEQGIATLDLWGRTMLIDFDGHKFKESPGSGEYLVIVEDGYYAYPLAKMAVNPATIIDPTKEVGSTFSIDINITQVEELYNWSLVLKWSPSLLDATTVPEGNFLKGAGAYTTAFNYQINQASGNLTISCVLTGEPLGGVNGSGVLATVTFSVEAKGTTQLDVFNAKLFERDGTFIPHDVTSAFDVRNDGYFSNQRRDIAITNVTPSKTSVDVGGSVDIQVTVKNNGEINETFTIRVLYGTTVIGSKSVTSLTPGSTTTLTFTWVTTNVPAGDYEIKAETSSILGDLNPADNSRTADSRVSVGGGGGQLPWTLIIGAVAVVAVIGVVGFFLMRRGKGSTKP